MFDQVQGFIARKDYARAIEALRQQSQAKPYNRRLRLRLCDVYVLAGREREAVPVLLTLADQFATDGFVAKAIAILKRIEKIEPGREDVESRLAQLIQDKSRRTRSFPPPKKLPPISSSGISFGLEEIDPSIDIQLGSRGPVSPEPVDPGVATTSGPGPASPGDDQAPEFDASFQAELDVDEDDAPLKEDLSTPLFDGFSPEELVAVMHGLRLVSFEPGDLIMVEGEAGESMFILTSGRIKAYVRTPSGKSTKVQEFEEGDFFGEIAVLTGKPRTATLTAAEECDCLELDRAALDEITRQHPRVTEVLKKFQQERAMSTVQTFMAERE